MKRTCLILSVIFFCLCFVGCSQKQKAVKVQNKTINPTEKVVGAVLSQQPQFQTANASKVKFSVEYQQRKVSSAGSISVIADSLISVSVQPLLGIELLRAVITKDAITVIDKMNRRYCVMTYEELQKATSLKLTYNDVEAILLERMFAIGHTDQWLRDTPLQQETLPTEQRLMFSDQQLRYMYQIAPETMRIKQTTLTYTPANIQLAAQYSDFSVVDGVTFPLTIQIGVETKNISGECLVNLQKIEFNKPLTIPLPDTNRLQKVNIETIIPR